MSLEAIKAEMAELPSEQQDHLAAYLVHLRHQRDAQVAREIANRIDDKEPKNWLSLNELREKWKG